VALAAIQGVAKVKVDCHKRTAWVTMKDEAALDPDTVTHTLVAAGYGLEEFTAPARTKTVYVMTYKRRGGS